MEGFLSDEGEKALLSSPQAQATMTSRENFRNTRLMSTILQKLDFDLSNCLSKYDTNLAPESSNTGKSRLIFEVVKVGLNFVLQSFHLSPLIQK